MFKKKHIIVTSIIILFLITLIISTGFFISFLGDSNIVSYLQSINRLRFAMYGLVHIIVSLLGLFVIFAVMAVHEFKKTRELEVSHAKLEYLVEHDYLTKLPNRFKFRTMFEKITESGKDFALILFDIDDFKNINDNNSHTCGDEVLRVISTRLLFLMVNGVFFASRFGGDEFLILYTNGHLGEDSEDLVKIKKIFDTPIIFENKKINVQSSMGIVNSVPGENILDKMISNADIAMYEAKKSGKNKIVFFTKEMKNPLTRTNIVKMILEDAIKNDGIRVVYQPQIDVETGKIHGYEALMRLKDDILFPAEFIPVAEETGLIVKIDRILTEKVIQQMAQWRDHGIPLYKVSINYSYAQIEDETYVDFVDGLLKQYKIDPEYIGIEVTESLFAGVNKDKAMKLFNSFVERGITLALDDFGTGYSSLSYLTYLPVCVVKIDKTLVDNYLDSERDGFIKNIVRLVHSLKMKLTVEGVEQEWQQEKLKGFKCDYIQGYYYSKPIPGEKVESFVKEMQL